MTTSRTRRWAEPTKQAILLPVNVVLPDHLVEAARLTEPEARQELAVVLFAQERLTLDQAARLAGMPQHLFLHVLGSRDIPIHYDVDDFEADLETLRALGDP